MQKKIVRWKKIKIKFMGKNIFFFWGWGGGGRRGHPLSPWSSTPARRKLYLKCGLIVHQNKSVVSLKIYASFFTYLKKYTFALENDKNTPLHLSISNPLLEKQQCLIVFFFFENMILPYLFFLSISSPYD